MIDREKLRAYWKLLSSADAETRKTTKNGFCHEFLDAVKGYVRHCATKRGVLLSDQNVKDIATDAIIAILVKVERNELNDLLPTYVYGAVDYALRPFSRQVKRERRMTLPSGKKKTWSSRPVSINRRSAETTSARGG